MYEDLLLALQCVRKYGEDPFVNMFRTTQIAQDCADAIIEMNRQLTQVTKERNRYRDDSVVLSLMLLCDASQKGNISSGIRSTTP